jgi:hypothetical protein
MFTPSARHDGAERAVSAVCAEPGAGCTRPLLARRGRKHLQKWPFSPRAGSARDRQKAGGRFRQSRQQKIPICRMCSAGATGLEPATSGVTGLFHRDDAWPRLTRNRSIDTALRASGVRFVHDCLGSISSVCCPSAARAFARRWAVSAVKALSDSDTDLLLTMEVQARYRRALGARFSCKSALRDCSAMSARAAQVTHVNNPAACASRCTGRGPVTRAC